MLKIVLNLNLMKKFTEIFQDSLYCIKYNYNENQGVIFILVYVRTINSYENLRLDIKN